MVRGRYLATFLSNCFGISRKLVAELVTAAVLVATSGHPRSRNRAHFIYDLHERDRWRRADHVFHPQGFSPRGWAHVGCQPLTIRAERKRRSSFFAQHTSASTQNDPAARDCARGPFSTGAALLNCQRTSYKPFTPGGSAIGPSGFNCCHVASTIPA